MFVALDDGTVLMDNETVAATGNADMLNTTVIPSKSSGIVILTAVSAMPGDLDLAAAFAFVAVQGSWNVSTTNPNTALSGETVPIGITDFVDADLNSSHHLSHPIPSLLTSLVPACGGTSWTLSINGTPHVNETSVDYVAAPGTTFIELNFTNGLGAFSNPNASYVCPGKGRL